MSGLSVAGQILSMALGVAGFAVGGPGGTALVLVGMGVAFASSVAAKPDAQSPTQTGRDLNVRASRQPIKLVYGEATVPVNKTFYHVANPYLHIVCELGEGEIDGIVREDGTVYTTTGSELPRSNPPLVYLDGKLWTEYVYYGIHSNLRIDIDDVHYPVYMEFFNGSASQGVCSTLSTASGGKWDQALRRTAYLYLRLEYSQQCWQGEPDVTARVRGLRVYDPIADTTAWTENPALCAYDYMTRSAQRGGIGVAAARVGETALDAAIDYCTAKGWTCNLAVSEQAAVGDNIAHILACFRGDIIYSENLFKLRFRDLNYETVAMDLTEADVLVSGGKSSLRIRQPEGLRPNTVRATWMPALRKNKAEDYVFPDAAAVAADGDVREEAVALYGVDELALVQKLCAYTLERLRLNRESGATVRERAMVLEPLDLVTLTHSLPGWDEQVLRVTALGISGDHKVALSMIEEDATFYDDAYNLTPQNWHDTTLIDPTAEPPDVINAAIAEESYDFRLRAFTRLNVTFDPPADYPWFKHAEVWISTDQGTTFKFMFAATISFSLDPVEEGTTYQVLLRTVNVFGKAQNGGVLLSRNVVGRSATVPDSLDSITAIVTAGALNLYGERVNDPDIELYEFRLGASWAGGVFLAAQRAPVLSLAGVRPGSHTIWANTLATNGLYGATPRSAGAVVADPPEKWTVASTQGPNANLITNGDMELDSDWASFGTPTANVRSSTYKHSGTYSRGFTVDAADEGIVSAVFTTVTGADYSWSLWVYPSGTSVRVIIGRGDDVGASFDQTFTGLTSNAWNYISGSYTEASGGASAKLWVRSPAGVSSATWYVDDACLLRGAVSGAAAYLYNSEACIRLTHSGGTLTGTWTSQIFDLSSSARRLVYALSDVAVFAGSGTWSSIFPAGTEDWADAIGSKSWAEVFAPGAAPQVLFKLKYGDTSPPASTVERLEILCAVVTGRYFQLEATITDPNQDTYGLFESPTLKFAT